MAISDEGMVPARRTPSPIHSVTITTVTSLLGSIRDVYHPKYRQKESDRCGHRAIRTTANLWALHIIFRLQAKRVAIIALIGTAYSSLQETTEASRYRLATDGQPTLGIRRLIALPELATDADTVLTCLVKVSLESRVTPWYFTAVFAIIR